MNKGQRLTILDQMIALMGNVYVPVLPKPMYQIHSEYPTYSKRSGKPRKTNRLKFAKRAKIRRRRLA